MPKIPPTLLLLPFATACATPAPSSETDDPAGDTDPGSDGDDSGDDDADDGSDGDGDGWDPAELCEDDERAGAVGLRRLTRAQLSNSLRDLLGIDASTADELVLGVTPDDKLGAFDANLVAVSELAVEQLVELAETVASPAHLSESQLSSLLPCGELACADEFVESFGRRAFRRPLTTEERERYEALQSEGEQAGGTAEGLRIVVEAMLGSPFFLYHVESLGSDHGGYVLASRLSYLLWGSLPDDVLLDAAETGGLGDPAVRTEQAQRMLDDPRAADAMASFHTQWLGLDHTDTLNKDAAVGELDDGMRAAMVTEAVDFADWVLHQDDGRLQTLLTSGVKRPPAALWELYGIDDVEADGTVDFGAERPGILTHAGVMAVHSLAGHTSPIQRGVLVRENILCGVLPPPPPGAVDTPPSPEPGETTQEAFERHTSDPSCAGCHAQIDPLGFPFESYDTLGRYRTEENGVPIDTSGEITGTQDADGPIADANALVTALSGSRDVHACATKQWLRFALPRPDVDLPACVLDGITETFVAHDGRIEDLLLTIVASDAFATLED
ncbi:MAG: DUF1588 domain-containing protein [Myxococcota bacterium]